MLLKNRILVMNIRNNLTAEIKFACLINFFNNANVNNGVLLMLYKRS